MNKIPKTREEQTREEQKQKRKEIIKEIDELLERYHFSCQQKSLIFRVR